MAADFITNGFHVHLAGQPSSAAIIVADAIETLIREKAEAGEKAVLGLATGSTPIGVYAELVRRHREGGLSFDHVVTFNLDEYHPMAADDLQSYVRFMHEHLFDQVDIRPDNVHIPRGGLAPDEIPAFCREYEQRIVDAGGIDLQLLGIGRTGHIGFNEPGSAADSRSRLVTLDRVTRTDAASGFFGLENVPRKAITMGIGTVMDARRVVMMAQGENKAAIVARAVEGDIDPAVPATFLQRHPRVDLVLDEAAAAELTACRTPWRVGPVDWTDRRTRAAAIWLSRRLDKAILKLQDEDYNENGLSELLTAHGPAAEINLQVFRHLQSTITGWPGGKPPRFHQPGDRRRRFEDIYPKRVLVFSPHPDDDVISMGGTLIRLADHGHEVHIAYQTSGNVAVFDDDALRYAEFLTDFARGSDGGDKEIDGGGDSESFERKVESAIRSKRPGELDPPEVLRVKTLIRRQEAKAGARAAGVPGDRLHFMELPFYETGKIKKDPPGDEDRRRTIDLLRRVEPHQIYAAGDLSDPHGTHRTCLNLIREAFDYCRDAGDRWVSTCETWLYRGAWQEWAIEDIEMAVPLSPDDVECKRVAIFKHESQKDRALFPGADSREFWERAEQRNANTAARYDRLGLAEYAAIEGFVRWEEAS